ncbi:transferase, chloramphenicol acetyltransferase-like domain protein [Tanacetum coccineum]
MFSNNDEAKMVLYNAFPKKEYERIFMCKTAKDVWNSLVITRQGNKQVKDNKIDLFVQQYEQFFIFDDATIDCAFARFNTIVTSLKALDESFSSRSHVRKFLRALLTKWRPKKVSSDEEASCSDSDDEEYAMAVHLKVKLEPDKWIKDSGCSRHMTGNKDLFSTYEAINGGNVVFGSNTKSKIIDKGQICDKKCKVLFSETDSEILKDENTIGRGIRKSGLYVMKIDHGQEFDNEVQFGAFCDDNGITHNFSAPRTNLNFPASVILELPRQDWLLKNLSVGFKAVTTARFKVVTTASIRLKADSVWLLSLGLGIRVYTSIPVWPSMVIGKFIEVVIIAALHCYYCLVSITTISHFHPNAELVLLVMDGTTWYLLLLLGKNMIKCLTIISSQIQNAIDNAIPSLVDASVRSYMSGHILHVHPAQVQSSSVPEQQHQLYLAMKADPLSFAVRTRDQDDPHDDAHPEGENSVKSPSTSGNQEQDDEFDFWTDSYASDDDEIPTKKVTQDIMEEISLTIDEAKLKKMADEMLRQRCTSGDEHQYHIDQMKNFLQSDIVWESRKEILVSPHPRKITPLVQSCQRDPEAPVLSLINQDLLYLKKGIEEYDVFSIVYEPVHGIIYTNSKKEKRVMRHSEIHKFCDATLRRTLEGLKSYYNDVKYGYVQKELTNDEVEFLKLFEEEIEVRLNYRDQMRRWEMYFIHAKVNIKLHYFLGLEENAELVDEFIPFKSGVPLVFSDMLLVIQVTMFEFGGLAVGVSVAHKIADASTICTFLNEWASMNQEENVTEFIGSGFNSSLLFPPRYMRPIPPRGELPIAPTHKSDVTCGKFTCKKLSFSESAISNMKAKPIAGGKINTCNLSKVQLVSEIIWKALIGVDRAIHNITRESILLHPVNLRGEIASLIPKRFLWDFLLGLCNEFW